MSNNIKCYAVYIAAPTNVHTCTLKILGIFKTDSHIQHTIYIEFFLFYPSLSFPNIALLICWLFFYGIGQIHRKANEKEKNKMMMMMIRKVCEWAMRICFDWNKWILFIIMMMCVVGWRKAIKHITYTSTWTEVKKNRKKMAKVVNIHNSPTLI